MRVATLESQVKSSSPASSLPSQRHAHASHTPSSVSRQIPGSTPRGNLQAEMGYLSLSAMAEFTGETPSSTTAVSFPSLVQATTSISGCNPCHSDVQNEAITGSLGDFNRGLMRQGIVFGTDRQRSLARFMSMINCGMPFMSSEQLSLDYRIVSQQQDSGSLDLSIAEAPCRVIRVYMAVASGMLMSGDYRYTESFATVTALSAFQLVPRALPQASDLETAQCLTAMAIFASLSPFGGSTWHLLGLAITRCISAGMHTARMSNYDLEQPEKAANNRIFWALYIFDATLSTVLGRPFCLQDQDISAPMPPRTPENDSDSCSGLFAWKIQHARLLHDIRNNPSKGTLFHWSNFRHWKENFPANTQTSSSRDIRWFREKVYPRALCRGLVTVLQTSNSAQSVREIAMIIDQATEIFDTYFEALDKQSRSQDGALTNLDGIEVFSAAIALIYTTTTRNSQTAPTEGDAGSLFISIQRPLQLLTSISDRFRMLRGLRDALEKFVLMLTNGNTDIQSIMNVAEGQITHPTKHLMQRILDLRS